MAILARPRRLITAAAVVAVTSLVVAGAVFASGYDAQEAETLETSVWVTRSAGQYARVDTELAEIDTVRDAEDPTAVAQSGASAVVYTDGLQKAWEVDPADPQPIGASSADGATGAAETATPAGTREVVSSGDWSAYLTDTGKVFVAQLSAKGAMASPVQIDPLRDSAKEGDPMYAASAVAVADDGAVVLYSHTEGAIRRYDAVTARFIGGPAAVATSPTADAAVALTVVGGRWVLGELGEDRLWIEGRNAAIDVPLGADAVAQRGSSRGATAYFADGQGLVAVNTGDGSADRIDAGVGAPAVPTPVTERGRTTLYAAWLTPTAGTLWRSDGGSTALEVPAGEFEQVQEISPVFASNGQRAVLNEIRTGLLWTVPDGALIPLSQWQSDDEQIEQQGLVEVSDVAQQEPPVAESDVFGVRADGVVLLPVLLNDHDPNKKDVLTVDPESLAPGPGDPGFGDLSLTDEDQQVVMRVRARSGTTTFGYTVTDGQARSASATVTLTVVPDEQNSAPKWCGVEGCLAPWPTAEIAPGGTISVPVLDGWVDPEGDPMVLASAEKDDPNAPLTVVPTADGHVAIRHTDPNAVGAMLAVTVTVVDAHGASTSKVLQVVVSSAPTIEAKSIVVVAGVDQQRVVSIPDHVTGGSGSYRLIDAVASGGKDVVTVIPNVAAGSVQLAASAVGEYIIGYTVQDAQTESQVSGVLRFSVVSGESTLALRPLTAFVRDGQDTTLDVLDAVQNTSGRVLALASATTRDNQLSLGVVEGAKLRVSGTTPDGKAGKVGTAVVTVTDGAGTDVTSVVTVFLTTPALGIGPIAVSDSVAVRAGEQIDIAVVENDIAPRGERIVVHPGIDASGTVGELAFVAGDRVRYLAPAVPGDYVLRYSVYLESDPTRLDSAAIAVTVLPSGENHAPEPTVIEARVAAGQTVRIPVPTSGVDPDGDQTALVAVDEPPAGFGAATITARGAAIAYSAPAAGVAGGQLRVTYTLRDGRGAEGVGVVRIAVLDGALADVAPVTYTDAVRAVTSSVEPFTVRPLLNDRDPAGGVLELVSLVPNAPEQPGDSEYARLAGLIHSGTDLAQGVVSLGTGNREGVQSYIYTVRSSVTSSTAQGLIVVTVSGAPGPDQPVVDDTVVTIADRSLLSSGIDVVADKTVWASGDVRSLQLAVWGDAAERYTAVGQRISGPTPAEGALVPFSLTGRNPAGAEVIAYGFLRIPALDAMRLQLKKEMRPVQVDEDQSVVVALSEVVQLGAGDALQMRAADTFTVQRGNAVCAPSGAASVLYSAGRESPWSDSCTVQVRINGQQTWTSLPFPLVIRPSSPQAILTSISRTVAPGATQAVDLYGEMTGWEGDLIGDPSQLDYRVDFTGSDFTVQQAGSTVTITARAGALPGARETATVRITAYGGLSASISLIVGAAPVDSPRGATFTAACDVSTGPSCTVAVAGIPGEYDPFAGTPGAGLQVAGIGDSGCAAARIAASGSSSVTATWPSGPKPAGGVCIVPFTVVDAQGRTGGGTLTLDVQGYPDIPDSITTASFTPASVTMLVSLGAAANARPGVDGVAIYEADTRVDATCSTAAAGTYSCLIAGLLYGERHTYTARAVNPVGESLDTTPVVTWAYQPPAVTSFAAAPALVDGQTSISRGGVELAIGSGDDVATFQLTSDTGETVTIARTGEQTAYTLTLPVGGRVITVVPISQYQPPVGSGGGGVAASVSLQVAGTPYFDANGALTATSNTSLLLSAVQANSNYSAQPISVVYAVWPEGQAEPECRSDDTGNAVMSGAQASGDFTGLVSYIHYYGKACVTNGYGAAGSAPVDAYTFVNSPPGPTGLQYTVRIEPRMQNEGGYTVGARWLDYAFPDVPSAGGGFSTRFSSNYGESESFALSPVQLPGVVNVQYCWNLGGVCGDPGEVAPATAPTTVEVSVQPSCIRDPKPSDVRFSGAVDFDTYRTVTFTVDADTKVVTYRVEFRGSFAALPAVDLTRCYDPPPPEPGADPLPDPPKPKP